MPCQNWDNENYFLSQLPKHTLNYLPVSVGLGGRLKFNIMSSSLRRPSPSGNLSPVGVGEVYYMAPEVFLKKEILGNFCPSPMYTYTLIVHPILYEWTCRSTPSYVMSLGWLLFFGQFILKH